MFESNKSHFFDRVGFILYEFRRIIDLWVFGSPPHNEDIITSFFLFRIFLLLFFYHKSEFFLQNRAKNCIKMSSFNSVQEVNTRFCFSILIKSARLNLERPFCFLHFQQNKKRAAQQQNNIQYTVLIQSECMSIVFLNSTQITYLPKLNFQYIFAITYHSITL